MPSESQASAEFTYGRNMWDSSWGAVQSSTYSASGRR